jgi:N-glycosylase/DNA lyase
MRDERVGNKTRCRHTADCQGIPDKRDFHRSGHLSYSEMPRIALLPDQPFSLDSTLGCGQVFRWEKREGWWQGIAGAERICIRQEPGFLQFYGGSPQTIRDYFQLDLDLELVLTSVSKDPIMKESISRCRGLRIVRQPAWECLASYICATYANIPGIKRKISLLSETYGEPFCSDSAIFYAFPSAEAIAASDLCSGRSCSLGYRAPYLAETAREIAADPGWDSRIQDLSYDEARRYLLLLKGVGPKVADCVLLFAFGKYEAFPVDVWITRIMQQCYGRQDLIRYEQIAQAGREYFGRYAGYAQEYLFCNREVLAGRLAKKKDTV